MHSENNRLLKKVEVQRKLEQATALAKAKQANPYNTTNMRQLIANDDIRAVMEDILELSRMSETQKAYVKAVFIDKVPKKKAIKKAFGKDLGYQEGAVIGGIMESNAVKEFIDTVKLFYINVVPIAALKEVDIMLDPTTDKELALKAAKQIKDAAGVGVEAEKNNQLPVKIVINMPQQQNIQNNLKVTAQKGKEEE